jgi:hypothetical protein
LREGGGGSALPGEKKAEPFSLVSSPFTQKQARPRHRPALVLGARAGLGPQPRGRRDGGVSVGLRLLPLDCDCTAMRVRLRWVGHCNTFHVRCTPFLLARHTSTHTHSESYFRAIAELSDPHACRVRSATARARALSLHQKKKSEWPTRSPTTRSSPPSVPAMRPRPGMPF